MNRTTLIRALAVIAVGAFSAAAMAEEPNANAAAIQKMTDPARIDRDGQRICGFDLMSDSEKGGYRNMMHQTKSLDDRNSIRADHCARMKLRAKERGATAEE
jgi:hypothetical protein